MKLGERGPMASCPEHCMPCLRAHGDMLVLGTSEHSKAQGLETGLVPRKNSPPTKKRPSRESSDALGSEQPVTGVYKQKWTL